MVWAVQKTIEIPQFLVDKVVDVPVVRDVQVPQVPSWGRQSLPQLRRRHPCRDAKAHPHGPDWSEYLRDFPVARLQGGPCYAGCAGPTVAAR